MGAVAPTTRPTVPPRAPSRRPPGDAGVERLGRVPGVVVRSHGQALELGRAGVGGPAQDVREAVCPVEQWGHRLLAEIRVDGDRVGPEAVVQGDRLTRRGRADVATLRVHHDRESGRDRGPDQFEGGIPG